MPIIDSQVVGKALTGHETLVQGRDTMNYAASVQDYSPCYLDDEREGGVLVHPLFTVALTCQVDMRIEGNGDALRAGGAGHPGPYLFSRPYLRAIRPPGGSARPHPAGHLHPVPCVMGMFC